MAFPISQIQVGLELEVARSPRSLSLFTTAAAPTSTLHPNPTLHPRPTPHLPPQVSALENCEIISFSSDNLRVDESGAVALANRVFETFDVRGKLTGYDKDEQ